MEKLQRSVTFGAAQEERTELISAAAGDQKTPSRKASRPKTTGDIGDGQVPGTAGTGRPETMGMWGQRRKKKAKSMWEINREQRLRKQELNRQIERQLTMPVISGEKLKKMREKKERPIELNEEQREEINRKSFEAVVHQYKQLRVEEERRAQGGGFRQETEDSIEAMAKLKALSERVHQNIERLKTNSMMEKVKREEKRRLLEQSRKNMLMIYQEEDMTYEERMEKSKKANRRKLVARMKIIVHNVASMYRKRLNEMEIQYEEKFSAKARLLGKARKSRQFNSIFEAVVFMGYVKETEETMMLKKTWDDVRKCRYLRGHEPEDMRIPEDENFTDFVFGKTQSSEKN